MSMNAEALFRFCRLMFWKEGQHKNGYKTDTYLENSCVNDDMISHITVCLRYAPVDNLVISALAVSILTRIKIPIQEATSLSVTAIL